MAEAKEGMVRAAVVRVFHEGRILLLKRADNNSVQGWCLPGGKLDDKDKGSMLTCAHRELWEETGIKDYPLRYIGQYLSTSNGFPCEVTVYETIVLHKDVVLSEEHSAAKWVGAAKEIHSTEWQAQLAGMTYKAATGKLYAPEDRIQEEARDNKRWTFMQRLGVPFEELIEKRHPIALGVLNALVEGTEAIQLVSELTVWLTETSLRRLEQPEAFKKVWPLQKE